VMYDVTSAHSFHHVREWMNTIQVGVISRWSPGNTASCSFFMSSLEVCYNTFLFNLSLDKFNYLFIKQITCLLKLLLMAKLNLSDAIGLLLAR